jgi:hypothetical protein
MRVDANGGVTPLNEHERAELESCLQPA